MKKALLILLSICLAGPVAVHARGEPPASSVQRTPLKTDLVERKYYTNQDGRRVHAPAHTRSGNVPPGASAHCRDGSYSFSTHRRGTCSRHGGVAQWL
jgi:hypothetical protein